MHLHMLQDAKRAIAPALLAFGRELLCIPKVYGRGSAVRGYRLSAIARLVLAGAKNEATARRVCELILEISGRDYSVSLSIEQFCWTLTELHPRIVSDLVLDDDDSAHSYDDQFFGHVDDDFELSQGLIPSIDPVVILDWVRESPEHRAVRVAVVVPYARIVWLGIAAMN